VKRTVTVGKYRISLGALLFCGGLTFWIGNMLLRTGGAGFTALWASLYYLLLLLLVASATRTMTLGRLTGFFCLGGTMMSLMYVLTLVLGAIAPRTLASTRPFLVPFLEETIKLAPVVLTLWLWRNSRLWTRGATDVLLMAAASGAGFGLVEDAYIRMHQGNWQSPFGWLPVAAVYGNHYVVGHQIWTTLAGATLGLASLWRRGGAARYALAASGYLWSMLDHSANNLGRVTSGFGVDFMTAVDGNGSFTIPFLFIALVAVVVADLYAIHGTLPIDVQPAMRLSFSLKALGAWWTGTLERRKLAFLVFRTRSETGRLRAKLLISGVLMHQRLGGARARG